MDEKENDHLSVEVTTNLMVAWYVALQHFQINNIFDQMGNRLGSETIVGGATYIDLTEDYEEWFRSAAFYSPIYDWLDEKNLLDEFATVLRIMTCVSWPRIFFDILHKFMQAHRLVLKKE